MPFSMKTIDFLFENHLQNSRAWFAEHKAEYQQLVYGPLQELVVALTPTMLEIDRQLTTEPRVDKTICRIWRDTRYSHDKSLYRDTMWIIFKRGKMHGTKVPGLYFEIAAEGFHYGAGFYQASAQYMETLRRLVLAGDELFQRAQAAYAGQDVYRMQGECFRRPRYGDRPEEQRLWLERRNIAFEAESADLGLLFSPGLAAKLAEDFRRLAPVYHFLLHVSEEERGQAPAGLGAVSRGWHPDF